MLKEVFLKVLVDHLISTGVILDTQVARKWLSTAEETPKNAQSYYQHYGEYPEFIVMISGGVLPTTLFFDGEGWFDHANEYYSVTHWMPMPLPPKGVLDNE